MPRETSQYRRQSDESLLDYVYRISQMSSGVNRWGSSQYASMVATYDTLNEMKGKDISASDMWENMGVTVDLSPVD